MAKICNSIDECARHLLSGNLVAFPTETVYGLGANALNSESVLKIFEAKRRPLTDPVIVHVSSLSQALSLISETDAEIIETISYLANTFWPGPLTIVSRANDKISPILTANTGYIGIRLPNHPIALDLINKSGVPIAAPSANLFSHVSPTNPQHVLDDFCDSLFDIKVIDGGKCSFGIESTVAKVYKENQEIVIRVLRRGGISEDSLKAVLGTRAQVWHKENYSGIEISSEAPGQLIKHYSPNIETYLLDIGLHGSFVCDVSEAALIKFNVPEIDNYKSVISLSETGDVQEAINNFYECLRWGEVQGVKCIVIGLNALIGDHALALWDRIYRATSKRAVVLSQGKIYNKMH
jgi:L-threonylcarbamoyladenylate synthase